MNPLFSAKTCFQHLIGFSRFGLSAENAPYGEHDFGAVTVGRAEGFWKIDYYASDMAHGAEDPAAPTRTVRVLTIMLAEEYLAGSQPMRQDCRFVR